MALSLSLSLVRVFFGILIIPRLIGLRLVRDLSIGICSFGIILISFIVLIGFILIYYRVYFVSVLVLRHIYWKAKEARVTRTTHFDNSLPLAGRRRFRRLRKHHNGAPEPEHADYHFGSAAIHQGHSTRLATTFISYQRVLRLSTSMASIDEAR